MGSAVLVPRLFSGYGRRDWERGGSRGMCHGSRLRWSQASLDELATRAPKRRNSLGVPGWFRTSPPRGCVRGRSLGWGRRRMRRVGGGGVGARPAIVRRRAGSGRPPRPVPVRHRDALAGGVGAGGWNHIPCGQPAACVCTAAAGRSFLKLPTAEGGCLLAASECFVRYGTSRLRAVGCHSCASCPGVAAASETVRRSKLQRASDLSSTLESSSMVEARAVGHQPGEGLLVVRLGRGLQYLLGVEPPVRPRFRVSEELDHCSRRSVGLCL